MNIGARLVALAWRVKLRLKRGINKTDIKGPQMSRDWNSVTVPRDGAMVYVLSVDNIGKYEVPFPVLFKDDKWLNASTHEELDAFVAAWRPRD